MNNNIIDVESLIDSKNRSCKSWEKHNFLFKKLSKVILSKPNELKSNYKDILLLSADAGEALSEISKVNCNRIIFISPYLKLLQRDESKNKKIFKLNGHFENLPLNNEKFDLIVSNLYLHTINKKENHLNNIFNLLNENGLLICNFFAENSLRELKNSLYLTDEKIFGGVFVRLPPNHTMIEICELLSLVGFKELVSEKINYEIHYNHVLDLLKDIKGTGENSLLTKRKRGLMTMNYINELNRQYKKNFSNSDGLSATCDVVSVSCWKPFG